MIDPASADRPFVQVVSLLKRLVENPLDLLNMSVDEMDLSLRLLRRVRLLGWLATQFDRAGRLDSLPEAAAEQLESALAVVDARTRMAGWELDRIAWALAQHPDIRVIVLKGCGYLLRELPNAPGRLFADVDLLVAKDDLGRVEAALIDHGWSATELSPYDEKFYRDWSHEIPAMVHDEREVEVDVHHNIRGPYAPFRPDAGMLFQESRPIDGSRFHTLSDTDIILHAMTHLMYGGDLADGLRDLLDIDLMCRHFAAADGTFWERLADRAISLNLGLPVFYSLRYSARLLDTPVPESVASRLAPLGPSGAVVRLMDSLVPYALFPQHPDRPSARLNIARLLLFIRSHWVSMPPWMLLRHLSYKFYVRHVQWRFGK